MKYGGSGLTLRKIIIFNIENIKTEATLTWKEMLMNEDRRAQTRVHATDRYLENNAFKNWKMFKQRWNKTAILADINKLLIIKQKAQLMNCLGDDMLDALTKLRRPEGGAGLGKVKWSGPR